MFLTLRRAETRQTFSVWVYGEDNLRRGSGLFVGEEGVTFNHHFLLPTDGSTFSFLAGEYQADIFATVVGRPKRLHLLSVKLFLSAVLAEGLSKPLNTGVYFDWGPESGGYQAHSRAND
jgi:hypothetical protein